MKVISREYNMKNQYLGYGGLTRRSGLGGVHLMPPPKYAIKFWHSVNPKGSVGVDSVRRLNLLKISLSLLGVGAARRDTPANQIVSRCLVYPD